MQQPQAVQVSVEKLLAKIGAQAIEIDFLKAQIVALTSTPDNKPEKP